VSYVLSEQRTINSQDLEHKRNRVGTETRASRREQSIARGAGPLEIAGQWHTDNGTQPAPIEDITLHHENWSAKASLRP
jgi:hypothetical protein